MLNLNYVEKKLLKKVNLHDFKDNNLRMNTIIRRFRLKGSKEYRQYNSLVMRVQKLVAFLRKLPSDNEVRQTVTQQLLDKLYRLGVIENKLTLESIENCSVSAFCRRRLTWMLMKMQMAQHMDHAQDIVTHGHIRVANDVAQDPALLITRAKEDLVRWAEGSKYKQHIAEFSNQRDDYELDNC